MQPAFMEIILTQCKWARGFPQPSHMFQLSPTEQLASLDNAFQVQMGNGIVFQKDAEVAAQRFNMFQSGDHSSNGYGSKCPRCAKIAG